MTTPRTIAVFADTRRKTTCSGRTCQAAITFARTVGKNAWMCFTGDPVTLRTETAAEREDGREVHHLDFADNHWATCPSRADFGKARGRQ